MKRTSGSSHDRRHPGMAAAALVCLTTVSLAACATASGGTGGSGGATGNGAQRVVAATGEPIKVGFLSLDRGVEASTEASFGEQAAVGRINGAMNGINGRPLDVTVCHTDNSPENNISCANQLVQDKVAVVVDAFDYGSGAALPILRAAQIPVVGPTAFDTQAETSQSAFYFGPSQPAYGIGPLLSFKQQHLNDVTFAATDVPASHGYLDGFVTPAARALGLGFHALYYPAGDPNFGTIAATIISTNPDVAGVPGTSDEGQCTGVVQALRAAGYRNTIFAGFCTQFAKVLQAQAGSVEMYSQVWLPQMEKYAPPDIQKQLAMAQSDIDKIGDPSKHGFFTYSTYAAWMTLAGILRSMRGDITNATVRAALLGTKDFPSFLGPRITCDHAVWPTSSSCSDELLIAKSQQDGSLKPIGGGFLTVSPSVLPKS